MREIIRQRRFFGFLKADKRAGSMRFFESYRIFVNRLGGAVRIPRHAGSMAALGLIGGFACYGMVAGGYTRETLKLAGSTIGMGVDKIRISGNKRVSEIDVLQALGLDGDTALPILNIDEARARLSGLPWVERVSVRKIYPDKLTIDLAEKQPFAVRQKDGAIDIIDKDGRIIVPYNSAIGRNLPLFVGRGAAENAQSFLAGMQKFPDLAGRARAYIRVADRRWDILLDSGLRIKLPEDKPFVRLAQAEAADKSQGLFNRAIDELDLRLPDRMTVALSAEAAKRWEQTVSEAQKREKALKNGTGRV